MLDFSADFEENTGNRPPAVDSARNAAACSHKRYVISPSVSRLAIARARNSSLVRGSQV